MGKKLRVSILARSSYFAAVGKAKGNGGGIVLFLTAGAAVEWKCIEPQDASVGQAIPDMAKSKAVPAIRKPGLTIDSLQFPWKTKCPTCERKFLHQAREEEKQNKGVFVAGGRFRWGGNVSLKTRPVRR